MGKLGPSNGFIVKNLIKFSTEGAWSYYKSLELMKTLIV